MSGVSGEAGTGRRTEKMTASAAATDAGSTNPSRTAAAAAAGAAREQPQPKPPTVKRNACVVKLDGCRYTISEYSTHGNLSGGTVGRHTATQPHSPR